MWGQSSNTPHIFYRIRGFSAKGIQADGIQHLIFQGALVVRATLGNREVIHANDAVQRGPDVMGHFGEKIIFRLYRFWAKLKLLPFFLALFFLVLIRIT